VKGGVNENRRFKLRTVSQKDFKAKLRFGSISVKNYC
jgi:hypothetical protein